MPESRWTFLTNHAHVLVCIARDRSIRLSEVAEQVGITERATQAILRDLVQAGFVTRHRVGRRNRYEIDVRKPLRHPLECETEIGELLHMLGAP